MRILFVGNSYLYYQPNDVAAHASFRQFVDMASLAGHTVDYQSSFIGGASVGQLWNDSTGITARAEIATGTYDAVVLTPGHSETDNLYVDLFADAAQAVGAKLMIFGNWPYDAAVSAGSLAATDDYHDRASATALRNDAAYMPNALAYRAAYDALTAVAGDQGESAELQLTEDNIHPSLAASYLYANLMFLSFFGTLPPGPESFLPAGLTADMAGLMRQIAADVFADAGLGLSGAADAPFAPNATISGRYFTDANWNGLDDAGEGAVAGAVVRLLDTGGNEVATTLTAPDGTYSFSGLAAGSYLVEFAAPGAGLGFSAPGKDSDVEGVVTGGAGRTATFVIGAHSTLTHIDAGRTVTVPDDPAGYPRDPADYDTLIEGTPGPDLLNGTSAADMIIGRAGADTLNGYGGNDLLDGRAGVDDLVAGAGNDILVYDRDDIRIAGGTGIDTLITVTAGLQRAGSAVLSSVEAIDMTNGFRDNLELSFTQLRSSRDAELRITGDAGDVFDLDISTTLTVLGTVVENGLTFHRYDVGGRVVVGVEQGIHFLKGQAPELLGFTSYAIDEGSLSVTDVAALDVEDGEGSGLTYTLAGGADSGHFGIDPATGLLRFLVAPDFEMPGDADGNNIYQVTVRVTDSAGLSDTRALAVQVNNIADGHGPTLMVADSVTLAENGTYVLDASAIHDGESEGGLGLTYALSGADAALFTLDALTGVLRYATAPDFEHPADANGDNLYALVLTVSDTTGLTDSKEVSVRVTDLGEAPVPADFAHSFAGTSGADVLNGTASGDHMRGLAGADTVSGQRGDDYLDGGTGSDSLLGGYGNDVFLFAAGDAALNGGAGIDTVLVLAEGGADARSVRLSSVERIDLGAGYTVDFTVTESQMRGTRDAVLRIDGDTHDTLLIQTSRALTNTGSQTVDGMEYDIYLFGTTQVWVGAGIDVSSFV
ncbi:MAG: SdrD B-like domain-containing protein [Paracoccaceae bacterium]